VTPCRDLALRRGHLVECAAHVPSGSDVDMTDAIERQIERFAPGFRDVIRMRRTTDSAELEAYNPAYVGGDIAGGAHDGLQLLARPFLGRPYRTPDPGLFLCSASTPPGAGVHGMCGQHAAEAALRSVLR
jgi:phytoene dehydrogenase-like protein